MRPAGLSLGPDRLIVAPLAFDGCDRRHLRACHDPGSGARSPRRNSHTTSRQTSRRPDPENRPGRTIGGPADRSTRRGTVTGVTQENRNRDAAILFEGVRRTHPGATRPTLENLDLRVEQGEFVALTGESGSGKSTIIGLCSGRQHADTGRISVLGRDITRLSHRRRDELRRRVVTVFQEYELLPDRRVGENVEFTLEIAGIDPDERRRRADEALELVGLADRRDALPGQLSGGEQQRVSVARAIALRPVIVLADEPTGNLDEENGELIFDLLATLNQTGTTVLVATPDDNLVTRLGLRTLRIHDGRVRTYRRNLAAR